MTQTLTHAASADIRERATKIRLACFDVDGTLTDGRLYYDSEGRESKAFHVLDGQGLVLLGRAGIAVALITARNSKAAEHRAADLGVAVFTGAKDKLAQVRALCEQQGIGLDEVAFMGDDLPDLAAMLAVGLSVAPANAHAWIATRAHHVTAARGGEGAARELCDLLLDAQGRVDALLAGDAR
jgi:3-deoxy-D-manno-octulosonate 8-phosphate phosphatase (KDO 8-P phosphatase)